MRALLDLLKLSPRQWRSLLGIIVLASLGTASALFEPWLYRAVVDDAAGVLTSTEPLAFAERTLEDVVRSLKQVPSSTQRVFRPPGRFQGPPTAGRGIAPRAPEEAIATVITAAILLLLVRLFSEACRIRADNLSARVSSEIEKGLIERTFGHVTRMPLSAITSRPSGAIVRQVNQSDQVSPLFVAAAKEVWPELFGLVAVLSILGSLNIQLALITMMAVPVYVLVTWRMTRALTTDIERYYAQWDLIASHIQEVVAGMKTVQSHGAGDQEVKRLSTIMNDAYDTYIRRTRTENRYAFVQNLIVAGSKAGVLAFGGIRALQHQLTPGDIVLFLAYVDRVYSPIETLTALYVSLQQNVTSLRRAERLLAEPEIGDGKRPPLNAGNGLVEFEHVRFAYGGPTVIDDVSFVVRPGEHVAIVGPSGAGKTTLADLLAGLYAPQSGEVRLDGQRVDRVRSASLHSAVRGVAADGVLFRTSIRENIRYGRFDASDADVQAAAERAGLSELLERLEEGLETEIGEAGRALSVGERQRVLLARAFVARPRVLVLDEATANLDYRTEESVKRALITLSRGHTTIIVAHRKAMLLDVDRVIVVRDGRVEQQGTPAELLRTGGYFRDMMRSEGVVERDQGGAP